MSDERYTGYYFEAVDGNTYALDDLVHQLQDKGYAEDLALEMAKAEVNGWLKDHE